MNLSQKLAAKANVVGMGEFRDMYDTVQKFINIWDSGSKCILGSSKEFEMVPVSQKITGRGPTVHDAKLDRPILHEDLSSCIEIDISQERQQFEGNSCTVQHFVQSDELKQSDKPQQSDKLEESDKLKQFDKQSDKLEKFDELEQFDKQSDKLEKFDNLQSDELIQSDEMLQCEEDLLPCEEMMVQCEEKSMQLEVILQHKEQTKETVSCSKEPIDFSSQTGKMGHLTTVTNIDRNLIHLKPQIKVKGCPKYSSKFWPSKS